jgi:hypothetical protein
MSPSSSFALPQNAPRFDDTSATAVHAMQADAGNAERRHPQLLLHDYRLRCPVVRRAPHHTTSTQDGQQVILSASEAPWRAQTPLAWPWQSCLVTLRAAYYASAVESPWYHRRHISRALRGVLGMPSQRMFVGIQPCASLSMSTCSSMLFSALRSQ